MVRAFLCKFILYINFYETEPSASPESIYFSDVTSTSAVISWDPPPDEYQNGLIISYTIIVTEEEMGESGTTNTYTTSETTFSLINLESYRTYEIIISASTTIGSGPYSDIFTLTTAESRKSYFL